MGELGKGISGVCMTGEVVNGAGVAGLMGAVAAIVVPGEFVVISWPEALLMVLPWYSFPSCSASSGAIREDSEFTHPPSTIVSRLMKRMGNEVVECFLDIQPELHGFPKDVVHVQGVSVMYSTHRMSAVEMQTDGRIHM